MDRPSFAILSKKNDIEETVSPDFKIHSCSKKNSMVLGKNRHVDQLDKIEDTRISTCNYNHLILDKEEEKEKYTGEKSDSSTKGARKTIFMGR